MRFLHGRDTEVGCHDHGLSGGKPTIHDGIQQTLVIGRKAFRIIIVQDEKIIPIQFCQIICELLRDFPVIDEVVPAGILRDDEAVQGRRAGCLSPQKPGRMAGDHEAGGMAGTVRRERSCCQKICTTQSGH